MSTVSLEEFNSTLKSNKMVVVDFSAEWCGPCKIIAPIFHNLSQKYSDIKFISVDVDKSKDVARLCKITSMPTFHFYKNGKKFDDLVGADPSALESKVQKLKSAGDASDQQTNSNDLNNLIDKQQLEILNVVKKNDVIFNASSNGTIESDTDQEIIISVAFHQAVKLHSLLLRVPSDKLSNAPSRVFLFVNKIHVSFDDLDSIEPTQELQYSKQDYVSNSGVCIKELRFVKFQNVVSLSIYIKENLGDEETTILSGIQFIGYTLDQTKDLKEMIKKQDE